MQIHTQHSFGSFLRAGVVTLVIAGAVAGCASQPINWVLIEPHAPSKQATAVGINAEGAAWFFQCDEQAMTSGLRLRGLDAADRREAALSIRFDVEPAEQSSWEIEKNTYVLRGEAATQLARRAALAYDAIVEVDGAPIGFSLTGSHVAMIEMTRSCPFLDVK